MINLREKDGQEILKIANEVFSCKIELWAYGSRVNGQAHDGSDLDLVIRGPDLKEVDVIELEKFREALNRSNIPIIVQVFDWARIPKSFQENILSGHEPLRKDPDKNKG